VGHGREHLERAVREIMAIDGVRNVAASRWIETEAQSGAAGQRHFMNGAVVLETLLSARELLVELKAIEHAHGRERPRTLDLDLLVHGDTVLSEPDLIVPHPHLAERAFVLGPLAQIAPELWVPGNGDVRALLRALHSARAAGG
jgi:2-amino-4-hydroxy-6-hydroxymethyldihydropteridine diphosphokinase